MKTNLTSIIKKEDVYLKHFYDSLTLSLVYDFNKEILLCDVGTGAGFPGLVLKIFFPKINLTLIDSKNKKIEFINEVISEIDLKNVKAINIRVEDYVKNNRNFYDVVTTRAVAKLNIINELCLPLVKNNGCFIVMKSDVSSEIKNIQKNLLILNSKIDVIKEFRLPYENSLRTLIKIKKIKKISNKYPRVFNKIKNQPL